MNEILLIATTFETREDAEKLAIIIIKERLAACAQITGPTTSLYWWQGEIEQSSEFILTLKSIDEHYSKLEQTIKKHHPYETPEIIATRSKHCSQEYKDWLEHELNGSVQ